VNDRDALVSFLGWEEEEFVILLSPVLGFPLNFFGRGAHH
jgi:hypothetical protein